MVVVVVVPLKPLVLLLKNADRVILSTYAILIRSGVKP